MDSDPVGAVEPLRLKNPPIIEAAIGITIPVLESAYLERLRECVITTDGGQYEGPTHVFQNQFEMKIVDGRSTAITKDEHFGWRWASADRLHTVQFKLDGFAFSRLGHYETWETFTEEAKRIWKIYYDAIGPSSITMYGVRYINKVYLPVGQEISQYLRVYPKTPGDQPWLVYESALRLSVSIDAPRMGDFTHNHLLVPSDRPNFVAVILDNDFRYSAQGISVEDLWANIDAVRTVKDDYFRQILTTEFLETFNV